MQAIITKYLPFTNTKPARIKATCSRGSVTVSTGSADEEFHIAAAKGLIGKFLKEDLSRYGTKPQTNPWNKNFVTGQLPSMDYVHVFVK